MASITGLSAFTPVPGVPDRLILHVLRIGASGGLHLEPIQPAGDTASH
jgi:hypothetical protein